MALDKSESIGKKVTNIADARKERRDRSTIAYGRRRTDEPGGPNQAARLDDQQARPNVRPVRPNQTRGRRFDREKVDKIKAQLENGQYTINSLRIADLFIEHERHC